MVNADFLLIGGGVASATAAETLRLEGAKGSILILSAEPLAPYHRPPLSKQFLLGPESSTRLLVHPEPFYRAQSIELQLNTRVVAIDTAAQSVTTNRGERIGYSRLLIATGLRPVALSVPGATLAGVHSLRTEADCEAIRRAAKKAKRVVVLGASFLGMEIAMSLSDLGLEVTIIEAGPVVLPALEAPIVSDYFKRHAENKGISVLLSDTIAALHGPDQVHVAETASGRRLPCDLVVVAIGGAPATQFLESSDVALEQGCVVVDEQLRTSAANVFAAGDVTSFYDPVFSRRRHIEHWDTAIKQGRLAAKNMLGRRLRYDEVSYFFCEVGDVSFAALGAVEEANELIGRGDLNAGDFALFYLKDDIPRALFTVGRPPEETRVAEGLIRYRVNLFDVKDKLSDPGFMLDKVPTQTVLILQGGGALGAFECGVVRALEEAQIFPDIVAGVSIGAVNGAIIASNPRQATAALAAFWSEIAVVPPAVFYGEARRTAAAMSTLMFGVPKFFRPRWMPPFANPLEPPAAWTSWYDPAPLKSLIAKYVDFAALKASPTRLLVGAVNVTTAVLEVFDSYVDDLTAEHILASGSLPPGFPWTMIEGRAYWDGGIVSNSPLDLVMDRCGPDGKRVFIVDLYAGERSLPTNMMEVMTRRDEIVYSERIRSDLRLREMTGAYRRLVREILAEVDPAALTRIRHRPHYIQLMGDGAPITITRLVRTTSSTEPASRDYDFSDTAIQFNQAAGYDLAWDTLHAGADPEAERMVVDAKSAVGARDGDVRPVLQSSTSVTGGDGREKPLR